MTPRVTVLVPVFNRPEFVREAIESALAQECPDPFEVLVVDDGSMRHHGRPENRRVRSASSDTISPACGDVA